MSKLYGLKTIRNLDMTTFVAFFDIPKVSFENVIYFLKTVITKDFLSNANFKYQ